MKGIISILEVALTGMILILAFLYFFPKYSIKTGWDDVDLQTKVQDTLIVIDRLGKTHDFASGKSDLNSFMLKIFSIQHTHSPMVWWKTTDLSQEQSIPYFSKAKKATIVDVVIDDGEFKVYSFTLGIGYVY